MDDARPVADMHPTVEALARITRELDSAALPGAITILAAVPGEEGVRVIAPGHQNPAETYGLIADAWHSQARPA